MAMLSDATLESVVRNYVAVNRPKSKAEFAFYAGQPSLEAAIRVAAGASRSDGKSGKHPRKGSVESLKLAEEKLLAIGEAFRSYRTFDALLESVERAIQPIPGLNDVYAYDTASRIGAYLNIWPKHIYLYSSTRTGAKLLGIVTKRRMLLFNSLPAPFQELEPYEVEEALSNLKKLLDAPAPVSYFSQSQE